MSIKLRLEQLETKNPKCNLVAGDFLFRKDGEVPRCACCADHSKDENRPKALAWGAASKLTTGSQMVGTYGNIHSASIKNTG